MAAMPDAVAIPRPSPWGGARCSVCRARWKAVAWCGGQNKSPRPVCSVGTAGRHGGRFDEAGVAADSRIDHDVRCEPLFCPCALCRCRRAVGRRRPQTVRATGRAGGGGAHAGGAGRSAGAGGHARGGGGG